MPFLPTLVCRLPGIFVNNLETIAQRFGRQRSKIENNRLPKARPPGPSNPLIHRRAVPHRLRRLDKGSKSPHHQRQRQADRRKPVGTSEPSNITTVIRDNGSKSHHQQRQQQAGRLKKAVVEQCRDVHPQTSGKRLSYRIESPSPRAILDTQPDNRKTNYQQFQVQTNR